MAVLCINLQSDAARKVDWMENVCRSYNNQACHEQYQLQHLMF